MNPKDILRYTMCVPPAQFPLIAHFVKWLITPEDVELGPAFMTLDNSKYEDGLAMSYMMQVHDLLMLRPVDALIAANLNFHGTVVRLWISVDKRYAWIRFTKVEEE